MNPIHLLCWTKCPWRRKYRIRFSPPTPSFICNKKKSTNPLGFNIVFMILCVPLRSGIHNQMANKRAFVTAVDANQRWFYQLGRAQ